MKPANSDTSRVPAIVAAPLITRASNWLPFVVPAISISKLAVHVSAKAHEAGTNAGTNGPEKFD